MAKDNNLTTRQMRLQENVCGLIKQERKARKLNLEEVCKLADLSMPTISKFENKGGGEFATFIKLCDALHIDVLLANRDTGEFLEIK